MWEGCGYIQNYGELKNVGNCKKIVNEKANYFRKFVLVIFRLLSQKRLSRAVSPVLPTNLPLLVTAGLVKETDGDTGVYVGVCNWARASFLPPQ